MKHTTHFNVAGDGPGFLLWQLTNKWQAEQRDALEPYNLTYVQFVLLAALTYDRGASRLTQKELAAYTHLDEMMTSQVLRKLEQKRFIRRDINTRDKRAFIISPTATGTKRASQAVKIVEQVDQKFFLLLRRENLTLFIDMVRTLI